MLYVRDNRFQVWAVIKFIAQYLCHKPQFLCLLFSFHPVGDAEVGHAHLIVEVQWAIEFIASTDNGAFVLTIGAQMVVDSKWQFF